MEYPTPVTAPANGTHPEEGEQLVEEALARFQPIRGRCLRAVVEWSPFLVLPIVLAVWLLEKVPPSYSFNTSVAVTTVVDWTTFSITRDAISTMGVQMYLSGWVAAALAVLLLGYLFDRTGGMLGTIWDRGVLTVPAQRRHEEPGRTSAFDALARHGSGWMERARIGRWLVSRDPRSLGDRFACYVDTFDERLNSWAGSWGFGLFFALIETVAMLPADVGGYLEQTCASYFELDLLEVFISVGPIIAAFLIGLLAWRLLVIAWQVAFIGSAFGFNLQVRHPDRSGGLNPLGDLCSMIGLVLAVPALYLSGWIVILGDVAGVLRRAGAPAPEYAIGVRLLVEHVAGYADFFPYLLMVIVIFAIVAFVLPVMTVHRQMLRHGAPDRRRIDAVSQRIEEACETLQGMIAAAPAGPPRAGPDPEEPRPPNGDPPVTTTPGTAALETGVLKDYTDWISTLERFAGDCTVPEWPFNRQVALKFAVPQIVPLLVLLFNVTGNLETFASALTGALPV